VSVSHIKSNIIPDFTGTVTQFDSLGQTVTVAATDLVRPSDWNSVHNQFFTLTGNTNNASTVSGTNVVLSGGNGVTLIGSNSVIGFSVANQSVVPGIQSIQVSNTTYTTGNVIFSNANGASFGSSAGGAVTLSYTVPAAQTGISGIQVSDTTYTSGTVTFRNANGISFGSSGANGISASYTVPTQTNQTLGVYGSSQTTGQSSSSTVDARSLTFRGAGAASVGLSAGEVIISVAAGAQSNQTVGIYGLSNTTGQSSSSTYDARTLSIRAYGVLSVGNSNGSILLSTPDPVDFTQLSIGVSTDGNTAGDTGAFTGRVVFVGSNNITLSGSSNGGSATFSIIGGAGGGGGAAISAGAQSVSTGTVVFSNSNNVSFGMSGSSRVTASYALNVSATGGTSNGLSGLTFRDSNGVSFGLSTGAGVGTLTASVSQTAQTIGFYGSSQTTGSASSGTLDARSVSIIGAGIVSVGMHSTSVGGTTTGLVISATQSNQAFSAAGGSSAFQTLTFGDTNGVSFTNTNGSVGIASVKLSLFAVSNTTQSSSGTANHSALSFGGAGIASVGVTGGSVVVSVPAGGGAGDGGVFAGVSTGGNTAGSTGTVSTGNFVLVGSGPISLSQSTGAAGSAATVSIIGPATSSLVGWRGIDISTNGSTISVGNLMESYFRNVDVWQGSGTVTVAQSTSIAVPFQLDQPLSVGFIRFPASASVAPSSTAGTTGNSQFSYGHTRSHNFVIYSRGTGASSLSLQSVTSTQLTDQQSINVSAAANSTQFSYTNRATYQSEGGTFSTNMDYSSSAASLNFNTSGMTAYTGNKMIAFPFGISLPPGQYWLVYGISSSTASQFTNQGTRLFNIFSNYMATQANVAFGTLGAATNSSIGILYGMGSFTTAGGGTTNSIPISAISTTASHAIPLFELARIA